jgi:hypothetical protein
MSATKWSLSNSDFSPVGHGQNGGRLGRLPARLLPAIAGVDFRQKNGSNALSTFEVGLLRLTSKT